MFRFVKKKIIFDKKDVDLDSNFASYILLKLFCRSRLREESITGTADNLFDKQLFLIRIRITFQV
jgi:hypothetical protein